MSSYQLWNTSFSLYSFPPNEESHLIWSSYQTEFIDYLHIFLKLFWKFLLDNKYQISKYLSPRISIRYVLENIFFAFSTIFFHFFPSLTWKHLTLWQRIYWKFAIIAISDLVLLCPVFKLNDSNFSMNLTGNITFLSRYDRYKLGDNWKR